MLARVSECEAHAEQARARSATNAAALTLVQNRVKDLEQRMGAVEKAVKELEGNTQRHSLGFTKGQNAVKARVAALEKALGELPTSAPTPPPTADKAADLSELTNDVSELKDAVTDLFSMVASIPAPPSIVMAP